MNDQHNENGPTSRGNDNAGPGQPPMREAVIVTDESIQPPTDSAPITFGPLEPYREPGYEAVRALIHQWGRDVYENSRIWRAVEAFGDAMRVPSSLNDDDAQLLDAIEDDLASTNELGDGTRDYRLHDKGLFVDVFLDDTEVDGVPVPTASYQVSISLTQTFPIKQDDRGDA